MVSPVVDLRLLTAAVLFSAVVESCRLDQPRGPDRRAKQRPGTSFSLPCDVDTSRCPQTVAVVTTWFVFRRNSHHQLDVDGQSTRYQLDGSSLLFRSLQPGDSGVYHCAIAAGDVPRAGTQAVGRGTVLTVAGRPVPRVRAGLVWTLFTLLLLYSAAVLAVLVRKKTRRGAAFLAGKCAAHEEQVGPEHARIYGGKENNVSPPSEEDASGPWCKSSTARGSRNVPAGNHAEPQSFHAL
ncbi:uncharacterized protein LOC114793744 [Denticeps clupeoides]|uniref:uncharacterized protein LOC114793744 n=1 Tax=Denticeps clupeoides TaxID=299321 RepID=UPI0010A5378B|nr:uncharacterized protein LOC114793744 [Denticeps clupeoides]